MESDDQFVDAGIVVTHHDGSGGPMISVSISMRELEWVRLTKGCADLWREAQDDIDLRDLTLDERIALFAGNEVDFWCDRWDAYSSGDDRCL